MMTRVNSTSVKRNTPTPTGSLGASCESSMMTPYRLLSGKNMQRVFLDGQPGARLQELPLSYNPPRHRLNWLAM
jgi:hypothetical protein